jgi:hypothetical protein
VLFSVRDRQLAGLQDHLVQFASISEERLFRGRCVSDVRTTRERVIAESRLPVSGADQLGAIQELSFIRHPGD